MADIGKEFIPRLLSCINLKDCLKKVMDPELYRNSLARYANTDISSLLSGEALSQGIGLAPGFPPSGQLNQVAAARSFGPLPGYAGHALHAESHLQNIAAQGSYKGLQVSQSTFPDPYAGLRLTSQPSSISSSKSMFGQESVSQAGSVESSHKAWGLSNFVPSNSNMLVHPADLSNTDFPSSLALTGQALLNPPPAHTSKTSQLSQRLPYSGTELFSRTTKSPPGQSMYEHRVQSATPALSQSSMFNYGQHQSFHSKANALLETMSYDPVSPATTPGPDHSNNPNQTHQQPDHYPSLQDLASISSTQQKLEVNNSQHNIQKRPSPIMPEHHNKMQSHKKSVSQQDLYNGSPHMRQSPQQSNVGSPHVQISSPPAPMPSSTIGQAPPPVQAPADSTTKPKKSRARKKKDSMNEIKNDTVGQTFSPQNVMGSTDIGQHNSSNEFLSNQQNFLSNNRHQVYSSSSEITHNSSLMNSSMNQQIVRNQPSNYPRNVPSPNLGPSQGQNQSRPPPQQSPMITPFHTTPNNTQAGMTFSVSDALEMSREAVYANQGLIEGFGNVADQGYNMSESYASALNMDGIRRSDLYNGNEEQVFVNAYGGQFVSPNSVLNMDVGQVNNMNQPSTIDEVAFSSLMNESYNRDGSVEKRAQTSDKSAPYYSLTVKVDASQDDDLSHLAKPVVEKKDSKTLSVKPVQSQTLPQGVPPAAAPKPIVKNASGGTSFMDSFLSFLQGKKPETLSSMSSAIIHNKPQLPKYIPEPPRPKRTEFSMEKSVFDRNSKNDRSRTSDMTFSDSDDTDEADSNAVQRAITSLNNDNDNVKISTNKMGSITMKINLNKVKKAEEHARLKTSKPKRPNKPRKKNSKEKKFGLIDQGVAGGYSSGEDPLGNLPARQLASRRAKENIGKYAENDDDSDSDTLKPISKLDDAVEDDEKYDSDKDPAWTPFNVDKNVPALNPLDLEGKRKRVKGKIRRPSKSRKLSSEGSSYQPTLMVGQPQVVELDSGSDDDQPPTIVPAVTEELQVGDFVMEIKDERNTECYPIWKIESGRMLHKFELFTENSRVLHRSIPTFSSWLPNVMNSYKRVRVNQVLKQPDKEYVEVVEEDRPKPRVDSKLEQKYEEHPLVDAFNVYLQIFLSQALEPGFLSAIREADERFYLDALETIDKAVGLRLTEIDKTVRWKDKFKESVKLRPHIREIERPNLKQSCQASEFANQPAIKSVHLFGNPYDRFTLQETSNDGPQTPMEFMIGKTAARYVKPYHNLYHFKYNLFKRCLAKVNLLQDDNKGDNAVILDQCLQNRNWVLQIFEDLKKMLEKG
ncbi:protein of unknown function (DUF4211) [Mactra antiquata]